MLADSSALDHSIKCICFNVFVISPGSRPRLSMDIPSLIHEPREIRSPPSRRSLNGFTRSKTREMISMWFFVASHDEWMIHEDNSRFRLIKLNRFPSSQMPSEKIEMPHKTVFVAFFWAARFSGSGRLSIIADRFPIVSSSAAWLFLKTFIHSIIVGLLSWA